MPYRQCDREKEMIIITSGAYISQEMQAEIGKLPPAFLPLGNQKLIYSQVKLLKKAFKEKIYLTLPEDFVQQLDDVEESLEIKDLEIVPVNHNLSLGSSVLSALNMIDNVDERVRILHGDTLFLDLPQELDVISISKAKESYSWRYVDSKKVWSGFFSFSNKQLLVRCLAFSEGNFEYAIEHYKALMDLKYQEIPEEQWFDLGHMNTFFQSRAKMTTERAFNSIQINRSELWKSGIPQQKNIAESNWFRKIPADLRIFTPQYLGEKVIDDVFFYGLEYLYYLPLNELFVHGRNKVQFWENIYEKLIDVLSQMNRARIDSSEITKVSHDSISLYKDKTFRRVEEFKAHSTERQRFIWSRLDIDNIVKICIERSLNMPVIPSVIHGDFCFSNILFSSRSQQIKLIDPRGMNFNGEMTIFGDAKYDVAKLLHSAVGFYDLIIAQQYNISADGLSIRFPNKYHEFADFTLRRPFFKGVLSIELMPIVVLLFISMLPLHQDRIDRQTAFVLNAKRLFDQYVR